MRAAIALTALLLLAPLLLVDVPPLLDYPNHLARLYLLAHGSDIPSLAPLFTPHWAIIPNLAVDLAYPLLTLLPVHIAGRLILASLLLLQFTGVLALNRSAWGRKGRIALQIFGDKGSIVFDQERFNELQLFTADGAPETRGFRTILAGPVHAPYDRFIPAPGHGLGFNDLKAIEVAGYLDAIAGRRPEPFNFLGQLRQSICSAPGSHNARLESRQFED